MVEYLSQRSSYRRAVQIIGITQAAVQVQRLITTVTSEIQKSDQSHKLRRRLNGESFDVIACLRKIRGRRSTRPKH